MSLIFGRYNNNNDTTITTTTTITITASFFKHKKKPNTHKLTEYPINHNPLETRNYYRPTLTRVVVMCLQFANTTSRGGRLHTELPISRKYPWEHRGYRETYPDGGGSFLPGYPFRVGTKPAARGRKSGAPRAASRAPN